MHLVLGNTHRQRIYHHRVSAERCTIPNNFSVDRISSRIEQLNSIRLTVTQSSISNWTQPQWIANRYQHRIKHIRRTSFAAFHIVFCCSGRENVNRSRLNPIAPIQHIRSPAVQSTAPINGGQQIYRLTNTNGGIVRHAHDQRQIGIQTRRILGRNHRTAIRNGHKNLYCIGQHNVGQGRCSKSVRPAIRISGGVAPRCFGGEIHGLRDTYCGIRLDNFHGQRRFYVNRFRH